MGTVSPQASPSLNRNYRFGGRLAAMPSAEAIGAAARDHAAWQTFRPQASGLRPEAVGGVGAFGGARGLRLRQDSAFGDLSSRTGTAVSR
jgi:hypothetical protein